MDLNLQQLQSKITIRKSLKALHSNAFRLFLGLGLIAKRCKDESVKRF